MGDNVEPTEERWVTTSVSRREVGKNVRFPAGMWAITSEPWQRGGRLHQIHSREVDNNIISTAERWVITSNPRQGGGGQRKVHGGLTKISDPRGVGRQHQVRREEVRYIPWWERWILTSVNGGGVFDRDMRYTAERQTVSRW